MRKKKEQKLSVRLSLIYTVLFFIIINLFGAWMIFDVHHTELDMAVFDADSRVMDLLHTLENSTLPKGEGREDFLQERLVSLLGGIITTTNGAEIWNADGTPAASSVARSLPVTEELLHPDDMLMQKIVRDEQHTELLVSGSFSFADQEYVLIVSTDISEIDQAKRRYISRLLLFDAAGGFLIAFLILWLSGRVARPLAELSRKVDAIAAGNYQEELKEDSGILEVNNLSHSVSLMQGQISERIHDLKEKNEEQERFIGSLTHELRTPLTTIIGYSSLLKGKAEDPALETGLDQIHKSGVRIQSLTESLIRLLTIDQDPLDLQEVDLNHVLSECVEAMQTKAEQNGVSLSMEGTDAPVLAATDPGLLSILITNLMDNAVKAVDGCPQKNVTAALRNHAIVIADTGKGIPEEDQKKIFEPFFMVDRSHKHTYGGFGLGLAICARIRDVLDLKLDLQSEVNKGTVITVSFPH